MASDAILPDLLQVSDTKMRRIRNIDFCSQELGTLMPGKVQKITGTTLDAFGAIIQQVADAATRLTPQSCFFSSWIPVLANGRVREGGAAGTIREHVEAAVSGAFARARKNAYLCRKCVNGDFADAVQRPRWAIPICGGSPSHWVMGWVDFELEIYGIVDSIPELASAETWAKAVSELISVSIFQYLPHTQDFCGAVEAIQQCLGMKPVAWEDLDFVVWSPAYEERQLDSWSCGLFVMIAMQTFLDEWTTPLLGESAKEAVRAGALAALLKVP